MVSPTRPARTLEARLEELTALMEQMARFIPQMMRTCEPQGAGFDLTHHQFMLLCLLETQGPMNMATLRKTVGGAQSTVSEMIGRLARLGYLEKTADPNDSRAVVVGSTPRGRRVVRARRDHISAKHRMVLQALAPEDQERFVDAMRTMVHLMTSALGTQSGEDENA